MNAPAATFLLTTLLSTMAACGPDRTAKSIEAVPASPSTSPPRPQAAMSSSASIGTATMDTDGTIILELRAEGNGVVGDARLAYPRSHKDYAEVLKHLGGLRPGESKAVPPWPDTP